MRTLSVLALFGAIVTTLGAQRAEQSATAPFRLMSVVDEARWRRLLPATGDPWLAELFAQELIFYTDREMPRAYPYNSGMHAPDFNVVGGNEPYGNPNIEFPWGSPAGTHRSPNAHAVRFVHLPAAITWWWRTVEQQRPKGKVKLHEWEYPPHTTFGEVLLLSDPSGKLHTYEVRTRSRDTDRWRDNVYRPMGTRAELDAWLADNAAVRLGKAAPKLVRLVSGHPNLKAFDRLAAVDELPEMPSAVVRQILARPFELVMNKEWVREPRTGIPGFAPTTRSGFGIVPTDYDAALVQLTSRSCMTCHDDVGQSADRFDQGRDWRGRVRGSDGIFSFHIFEPDCISKDGRHREPQLRKALLDAGLLRHWQEPLKW
jgi:hypothetical protein